MRLLARMLRRTILRTTALSTTIILSIFTFVDLIAKFSSMDEGQTTTETVRLVALRVVEHLYLLLPSTLLIGTLFAFAQLVRDSEYVAMRVAGVSLKQLGGMLSRIGFGFALITFMVGELLIPHLNQLQNATPSGHRFWARDQKSFIRIQAVPGPQHVRGIQIFEISGKNQLNRTLFAKNGYYTAEGIWTLHDVQQTRLDQPSIIRQPIVQMQWHSTLTPQFIRIIAAKPEKMSGWSLFQYVDFLHLNQQDARQYAHALWNKLGHPLLCIPLILFALLFSKSHTRQSGAGVYLVVGIILGLLVFLVKRLFLHFSLLYHWPSPLSALLPTGLLLGLVIGGLWLQERIPPHKTRP